MPAAAPDVLVLGAGPVGCALALALADSRLAVKVLQQGNSKSGFRPIALSYASRLILERLRVWDELSPTPIATIRVSQAGAFGRTRMDASDAGVPSLGYVVELSVLEQVLRGKIATLLTAEEAQPLCTVHAEGASPEAKETPYDQEAVVALLRTEPAAGAEAFERFTPDGPLALLPLHGRYARIWRTRPDRARGLAAMPEAEFLAALAATMGRRPGRP